MFIAFLPYVRSLRLLHWVKNVLILAPALITHSLQIKDVDLFIFYILIFCLTASSVYCFNDLVDLEKDRKNLAKKLGRHELDILAENKPGLVVKIINRASKNELRCFELQTGAPHTEEELLASKRSQLNSECPTLANPNYTPENT